MKSRNLSVVEPHPSVVKSGAYIGSGIGGAGNIRRYDSTALSSGPDATGPASALASISRPSQKRVVASGRGGAGNMFRPTEEPSIFQFDEELVKRRESAAPMYHIGRGGAANFIDETKPKANRMNSIDSAASVNSDRSTASSVRRSMEGAFSKLARRTTKN